MNSVLIKKHEINYPREIENNFRVKPKIADYARMMLRFSDEDARVFTTAQKNKVEF